MFVILNHFYLYQQMSSKGTCKDGIRVLWKASSPADKKLQVNAPVQVKLYVYNFTDLIYPAVKIGDQERLLTRQSWIVFALPM